MLLDQAGEKIALGGHLVEFIVFAHVPAPAGLIAFCMTKTRPPSAARPIFHSAGAGQASQRLAVEPR
ncbi:hypothetical protein KWU_0100270 [Xanthomonas vasicola pv. musacearum NCPPB 4394]|nr:hypothetical protein KWU_0100270 [Xanthomonas vasicola pv. musacearum NCPPB 4394]